MTTMMVMILHRPQAVCVKRIPSVPLWGDER